MCGITGLFTTKPCPGGLEDTVRRMADTLRHRGPDDHGTWTSEPEGIALGFRRLSIVDLSALGHQPMASQSGRFTLAFNGEIYNHNALREELRQLGWSFRGHSDTEVMLAAFEQWGLAASLPRFIGMFAMALWDAERRRLTLVRDRLGKKPLFYSAAPGLVTFGSELKALVAGPALDRTLDPESLTAYLRYLYIPSPRSIWTGVRKLPPGTYLEISTPADPLPDPVPYWSVQDAAAAGARDPWAGTDEEAVDTLESLLRDSVLLRREADVPVGALLSGGIDSSTVVAIMQRVATRPVHTYTIGFDRSDYDEAGHAARVATHLGTRHTELRLTGEDALALVPRLPEMFDEPLADPSQLPTFLVCQLARREVTVALSGDGGDEVFAGYNRYLTGERLLPRLAGLPRAVRLATAGVASAIPGPVWDRLGRVGGGIRLASDKAAKVSRLARAEGVAGMYRSLLSACDQPDTYVAGGVDRPGPFVEAIVRREPADLLSRMLLADQVSYLPDDLLAKVDRASMAVSLEARTPLLDHRIVEFGWRLPRRLRIRGGQGKWILRQVLYRHVPRALVDRPKVGFSVPTADWLAGPLRAWAGDLLAPDALVSRGTLAVRPVQELWSAFDRGDRSLAAVIWALAVFRAWEDRWAR
jgi:asparagine synthase (glutamine-hydrolysing)